MADNNDKLREALNRLQAELAEVRKCDPAVASHLETIIGEYKGALDRRSAEPADHESVMNRLNEAVLKYEATHPTLSGNLGSIIDALARMGI